MEVKDVSNLLKGVIVENESIDYFTELYQNYRVADDIQKETTAQDLWQYMKDNQFLPEYFESDDDLDLASMLEHIAVDEEDNLAFKYALILLHHRFMLSDILEKAFVARMLIFFFIVHREMTIELLHDFVAATSNDMIYKSFLDEDDHDVNVLHFELIRAILPVLEWFHNQYPDQEIHGVNSMVFDAYKKLSESMSNKKSALFKLSAFCRYLYENIHSVEY